MRDTYTMGNDRMRDVIPLMFIALVPARERVAHSMTKVDTSVSKADSGQRRREQHLALSLKIFRVLDSSW